MKNKETIVTTVQHIWAKSDDRWVYLEYNKLYEIVGMNFMQGDDYEDFKDHWCHNDESLMAYYESMLYTFPIEKASVDTLTFVNKVMWASIMQM